MMFQLHPCFHKCLTPKEKMFLFAFLFSHDGVLQSLHSLSGSDFMYSAVNVRTENILELLTVCLLQTQQANLIFSAG